MKDRFSEASWELEGKSAFVCTSCETIYGHPTIVHLDTTSGEGRDFDLGGKGTDCILNCDPAPFGD